MLKRLLYTLFVVVGLASPLPQVFATTKHPAPSDQKKECVVYVTKTGSRYHRTGCSSLRSSRIPMSREEAIKGGYTPCKRCGGSNCEK